LSKEDELRVGAFGLIVLAIATPAQAYMGPGAGLAFIGSLFALIAALGIGALGLVWYPLKRLLQSKRETDDGDQAPS